MGAYFLSLAICNVDSPRYSPSECLPFHKIWFFWMQSMTMLHLPYGINQNILHCSHGRFDFVVRMTISPHFSCAVAELVSINILCFKSATFLQPSDINPWVMMIFFSQHEPPSWKNWWIVCTSCITIFL